MSKIKKSVRLEKELISDLQVFCEEENVNFSQAVNMALAAYFSMQKKSSKNYLSLMADYLKKQH